MKSDRLKIIFLLCTLCLVLPFLCMSVQGKNFVVVIDPGHGGRDPGAIGKRGKEKSINLNVALKVGQLIQSNCLDTKVIFTRSNDVFVPLHQRAEIANSNKADLFISIHTNSVASRSLKISGTETYTLGLHKTQENLEVAQKENSVILIENNYKKQYAGFNPNSSESYIIFEFIQDKNMSQSVNFAKLIQQQFRQNARRIDKGVHQAGFLVLRETSMPSVLIELGYITNPNEEAFLLSENGSNIMAKSIYQAFLKYKQEITSEHSDTKNISESATLPEEPKGEAVKTTPIQTVETSSTISHTSSNNANKPIFKIQILTSGNKLPSNSKKFKGLTPVSYYKEKGIFKYTFGENSNYNRILRIKKLQVDAKFKDAFIIAFKNGQKMNINEAIKEFKKNNK